MSRSRLENVVRIRTLQEQIARGEVERRRRTERQRETEVAEARLAVAARADDHPSSPLAFVAQRAMLDVGLVHVGLAEQRQTLAQVDVAQSVDDWTDASRRLEGVERLERRLDEQARLDEALRVQNEIDDLVVTRWKRGVA